MRLRIETITKLTAEIWEQNNQKWQLGFFSSSFYQWPEEGTTETEGWVETTWDQGSPYYDFCPLDPEENERN